MATMQRFKKRTRAFEGTDERQQAIRRIQDEASVRNKLGRLKRSEQPVSKDSPQEQQSAAEKIRQAANRMRSTTSHGGAPANPTTRGPHRMSYSEAFSRRTTDSSRNRVMALYGRKAPPRGQADRTISQPVTGTGRGRKLTPSTNTRGDYGGGLPDAVARMRQRRRKPTFGAPRAGAGSRRKYF